MMRIAECTQDKPNSRISPLEHWQCLYAMKLQILQEKLGLTYGESKLYLCNMEWGDFNTFIEIKLGVPKDTPKFFEILTGLYAEYERISKIVGSRPWELFGRFQDGGHGKICDMDFHVMDPEDMLPYFRPYPGVIGTETENVADLCRFWYIGYPLTPEEFKQVRYAKRLWFLQEAKFSYADARLYLYPERPESIEDLSGILQEDVSVLRKRFDEVSLKVDSLMAEGDIFHGHVPLDR